MAVKYLEKQRKEMAEVIQKPFTTSIGKICLEFVGLMACWFSGTTISTTMYPVLMTSST